MKRQHYVLSNNASSGDVATNPKRVSLADQQEVINQPHVVMHPACLLRLSHDALSEIMLFVDLPSIITLCSSSERTAALIASCVSTINLHSSASEFYTRHVSCGLVPLIKQGYFARLHSLCLTNHYCPFEDMKEKWLSLTDLPASLTKLGLNNVIINVEQPLEAKNMPNLANLKCLSLQRVRFSRCGSFELGELRDPEGFDVYQWMKQLLANPTNLLEFMFLPYDEHDDLGPVDVMASSLPPTLESLAIQPTLLRALAPTQWPPNLTALRICQFESPRRPTKTYIGKKLAIPITVTYLAFHHTLHTVCEMSYYNGVQVIENMCLTHPSQIRHLTVVEPECVVSSLGLMQAISKFSNLECLDLDTSLVGKDADYSLIPRSVKTIRMGCSIPANRWHQLPPNAQYVDVFFDFMQQTVFDISSVDDGEYMQHLPRQLTHVSVCGGVLPVHLPMLEHVGFLKPPILPRHLCSANMANLPRTLRSVDVVLSQKSPDDVFWLHDNLNQSLIFECQFPVLTKLSMATNGRISAIQAVSWLNHLPRTVTDLTLGMDLKARSNPISSGELDLRHAILPPYLEQLKLTCSKSHLAVPCCIPKTLQSLHLRSLSLQNGPELYKAIRGQIHEDRFSCTLNMTRLVCLENLEYVNGDKDVRSTQKMLI
jgi:hypothetical protein